MLRILKAERCDFFFGGGGGGGEIASALEPFQNKDSIIRTVNGELKFIQNRSKKIAFEAKGRLYTTGKVIRRLFIIDLHTQLAIYGYRWGKSSALTIN